MTRRKLLSICLAIAMTASMMMLAGCGSKEKEEPKPTNTQELLDASKKAQEDVENVSIAGSGKAEIKAGSQGQEMTVPASFELTADASKDMIHAKGSGSIEMFGEKQEVAPEAYVDVKNKKIYSKTEEGGEWTSSDFDIDTEDVKVELPESIKEKLEFSETDDGYVLECDLSKIDIKELMKALSEEKGDVESLNEALDAIDKANVTIDTGKLTLTYDKETYLLSSMAVKEFSGSGSSEITEGQNLDVTATMDIEFTFSDYNNVAADKFALPEGVE